MLSFDGKGINDRGQKYAPRIATFANDEMAQKWGKVFEAAPDMLSALELAHQTYENIVVSQFALGGDLEARQAIAAAIARAKGLQPEAEYPERK